MEDKRKLFIDSVVLNKGYAVFSKEELDKFAERGYITGIELCTRVNELLDTDIKPSEVPEKIVLTLGDLARPSQNGESQTEGDRFSSSRKIITYGDIYARFKKENPEVKVIDYRPQGHMGVMVYFEYSDGAQSSIFVSMSETTRELAIYIKNTVI